MAFLPLSECLCDSSYHKTNGHVELGLGAGPTVSYDLISTNHFFKDPISK